MTSEGKTLHHQNDKHWLVLLLGILLALFLWTFWLLYGVGLTHLVLGREAGPPAVSAPGDPISLKFSTSLTKSDTSSSTAPSIDRERLFTEYGQTGDSFGGLNSLLTAIAGALVAWAGFMQHQTLKQARQEARDERKHRQLQEFESLFFQLLQMSAAMTERIEGPKRKGESLANVPGIGTTHESLPGHKGPRALDAYARLIYDRMSLDLDRSRKSEVVLEELVQIFLKEVYGRRPSAFGPYFRLLFQTFKHVADSSLSEQDQIRYANIARGQISEGALLLLALNGMTYNGYRFVPLIEKFGLLEHLHRRYCQAYKQALDVGYRERAFLGSEQRSKVDNEWNNTPKLYERHFHHLETIVDEQQAFEDGFEKVSKSGFDPDGEE